MPKVTLNNEAGLYVIAANGGYSCLGYQVCLDRATNLAKWLSKQGVKTTPPTVKGSLDTYHAYETMMNLASKVCSEKKIRCEIELTPQLIGLEGQNVKVVDAHDETRMFKVGKSTGWMPVHLEIERGENGGPAAMGTPYKTIHVVAKHDLVKVFPKD